MSTPRVRNTPSEGDVGRKSRREAGREGGRVDTRTSKKGRVSSSPTGRYGRVLLAVLFLGGPAGTVVSFWLLPTGPVGADVGSHHARGRGSSGISRVRMVHLILSNSNRRARFVLDENTVWEAFLAGCRERLNVAHIRKVTDSYGDAILAVEDLVHDDHLVIHADDEPSEAGHGPSLPDADDIGPSLPLPLSTLSSASLVANSRSAQTIEQEEGADAAGSEGLEEGNVINASLPSKEDPPPGEEPRTTRPTANQLLQKLSSLQEEVMRETGGRDPSAEGAGDDGEEGHVIEPGDTLHDESDPLYDHENPLRPCGKRHPTVRLAMLIPWVNELPPWLTYFITTAKRSAFLIDWLIFHETLTPPGHLPDNVRFIDLGAGGLSQLFGLKMGEELGMPVRNASLLIRSMRFMLDKWPRLVAEYKPAFGSIFEQYITDYSHWGYCDLDMVIGNIPLFLEHRELLMQACTQGLTQSVVRDDLQTIISPDIVSYSFGDMDAFYLRGQWTIHRNKHSISTIWKACPHLGNDLQKELLMKVAWVRRMESRGIKNYPKRFQSAEGCYSHRATLSPGIRIKVAHKQFVGLSVPSDDQIYAVNGAVWQCPKSANVDVSELLKSSTQPCCADLPGVQEPLGEMLPLQVTADGGCGKWMPVEYRMCALNLPEPPERERDTIGFNTFLKEGKFYAQRFRS
ncbi:MAG: hypothetical protein SGPRY_015039, partial [Prymnesium sp.]